MIERRKDDVFDIQEINLIILRSSRETEVNSARISETKIGKDQFQGNYTSTGVLTEEELTPRKTFISKDRHADATPEDLSEKWGISISQAALTLKVTTRRLIRSALMPLARRYRVDRMFNINHIRGMMATDTMHMGCKSICGHHYSQVFGNKQFFVESYPINRKSDCGAALESFINEYGVPDVLIYDGSKEQSKAGTKFQQCVRKHGIKTKV